MSLKIFGFEIGLVGVFVATMQNQNDMVKDEAEVAASISALKGEEWGCCSVEDEPSFQEEESAKVPYVGDKVRPNQLAFVCLLESI